jgi:MFS family permease
MINQLLLVTVRQLKNMPTKQVDDVGGFESLVSDETKPTLLSPQLQSRHRFVVAAFLFLSNLICYADRTNMSVCIIPMASDFSWNEMTQASVLSSFFWGYMATQILSGVLCKKYGGKRILLVGVIVWSVFTLLTPIAASYAKSEWLAILIAVRIGMGLGEGANFPSVYHLCGSWIPRNERTRLLTFINSGTEFGTCSAMLLGPFVTLTIGWQWTFYTFGFMGVIWSYLFNQIVFEGPDDPRVSQTERDYINDMNTEKEKEPTEEQPFNLALITSLLKASSVWAIIIAQTCYNFGWYILLSYMPKILISMGIAFEKVGYFSVLSYVIVIVISNASAQFADMLINRLEFTVEKTRKIMQSISFFGSSVFYFLLRYTNQNAALSVLLLCLGIGCGSFCRAGYQGNHVDIAPRYAGLLFGISNTFATMPGIFGPLITGIILQRFPNSPWDVIFNIVIAMNIVGAFAWLAWAKGSTQFR